MEASQRAALTRDRRRRYDQGPSGQKGGKATQQHAPAAERGDEAVDACCGDETAQHHTRDKELLGDEGRDLLGGERDT